VPDELAVQVLERDFARGGVRGRGEAEAQEAVEERSVASVG